MSNEIEDKPAAGKTRIDSSKLTGVSLGTQLNGLYEIDKRIASGGMGEVYRGHNIHNDEPVAIKIVLPEFAKDETILALFRKEAKVLGRLTNDAIVRYHAFSIDPDLKRPYLAMEFVDGTSLADERDKGPIPPELVRHGLIRVAEGLASAHSFDVIHRDLTPENVILPDRKMAQAKIIDFGIAKATEMTGGTVLGDRFAGKYNFVSPEQLVLGGSITGKTDIYSLGLVIASCLRGEDLDMGGEDIVEVNRKRRTVPELDGVDNAFIPLLNRMLDPNPDTRIESMEAVVEEAMNMGSLGSDEYSDTGLKSGATTKGFTGAGMQSLPYSNKLPPSSNQPKSESPFGGIEEVKNPTSNIKINNTDTAKKKSSLPKILASLFLISTLGFGAYIYYMPLMSEITQKEVAKESGVKEILPEGSPKIAEPVEEVKAAVKKEIPPLEKAQNWLEEYSNPTCFFAKVHSTSSDEIKMEFFSNDKITIDNYKKDYTSSNEIPLISTNNILNNEQCGLTELLSNISVFSDERPFELHVRPDIESGGELIIPDNEPINGELKKLSYPIVQLLLLGNEGIVYDLGPFLIRNGDSASFSVQLQLKPNDKNKNEDIAPLIALAITSRNGLESAQIENFAPAKTFFDNVVSSLKDEKSEISFQVKYFRLKATGS